MLCSCGCQCDLCLTRLLKSHKIAELRSWRNGVISWYRLIYTLRSAESRIWHKYFIWRAQRVVWVTLAKRSPANKMKRQQQQNEKQLAFCIDADKATTTISSNDSARSGVNVVAASTATCAAFRMWHPPSRRPPAEQRCNSCLWLRHILNSKINILL